MKHLLLFVTLIFLLPGCSERAVPLNRAEWGYWDITVSPKRYNMSIWMIETNWFDGKSKEDIISQLPERRTYTIEGDCKIFCVKESDGWNIDHVPQPLAYLDVYFDSKGMVTKAVLREREQSFGEKTDGKGKVTSDKYKTVMVWEKK